MQWVWNLSVISNKKSELLTQSFFLIVADECSKILDNQHWQWRGSWQVLQPCPFELKEGLTGFCWPNQRIQLLMDHVARIRLLQAEPTRFRTPRRVPHC